MSNIIVLGDAMIDRWITATSTRFSAEQPNLSIYDIMSTRLQAGGASNVANALNKLNLPVRTALRMGDGEMPIKNRILVNGIQICRFDEHDQCFPFNISSDDITGNIVVISDYNKGAINAQTIETVVRGGASAIWCNVKTIQPIYTLLDMAGSGEGLPPVNWVCNSSEYEIDKEFYQNQENVWITNGAEGISFYYKGCEWPEARRPSKTKTVVSVCGAGDVTLASLIKAQNMGFSWGGMAQYSMYAAAISVEHPFTYCPTEKEVGDRYFGE